MIYLDDIMTGYSENRHVDQFYTIEERCQEIKPKKSLVVSYHIRYCCTWSLVDSWRRRALIGVYICVYILLKTPILRVFLALWYIRSEFRHVRRGRISLFILLNYLPPHPIPTPSYLFSNTIISYSTLWDGGWRREGVCVYVGDKYDEDICQYVIRYHESLIHTLLAYLVYLVIIILILFRVFMKEDKSIVPSHLCYVCNSKDIYF